MVCKLGLAIGKSFAELTGIIEASGSKKHLEPFVQTRWYLPKKNLAEGLKEALRSLPADVKEGSLWVAGLSVERVLERRQGKAPAVLVTSGFESWLPLAQSVSSAKFCTQVTRDPLPMERDTVFGLTERTMPNGKIATAVDREELEFIAAKLELLKIKDVAILLLNSCSNPENENAVAAFLRDKGFRTKQSHRCGQVNLAERWQATIEACFAESATAEEREQIQTAIKSTAETTGGNWQIFAWTPHGPRPWNELTAQDVRGGLDAALVNCARKENGGASLHCGLDGLSLLAPEKRSFAPQLKLTQLVTHGEWPFPQFTENDSGYEPGPMLFGRSHQLAMLDILYLQEHLLEVEGLAPLLSEKSRPRILETLFTLAKSPLTSAGDKRRPPDAQKIATDLETSFIEEIAIEIAAAGVSGELTLTGAFAASLSPLIAARRKDLKIKTSEMTAWRESWATLSAWESLK